jgi:hypothetical protein
MKSMGAPGWRLGIDRVESELDLTVVGEKEMECRVQKGQAR